MFINVLRCKLNIFAGILEKKHFANILT